MAKISPFVKLLRGEYELTIILLLTRLNGKARADEIIKAGKKTKTLPALNGARVATARKFLLDNDIIEIEKQGNEIIHILTNSITLIWGCIWQLCISLEESTNETHLEA
jgi:hypothetical protein